MENQSTHFIFDGNKVVISPDLHSVISFLQEIEKEIESFLNQEGLVLISIFIAMAFWLFDASNKNFRQDYKKRRDKVAAALRKIFRGEPLEEGVVSPDLPLHKWRRLPGKIFEAHVSILYLSLLMASLIVLWLV